MPLIAYKSDRIGAKNRAVIDRANEIIAEYTAGGFALTLRQLYYQFVARGLLANKQQNYKRLGDIINEARLAGLVDWDAIEDRTRGLADLLTFGDPSERIDHAARAYRRDLWADQPKRIEVWVEKEALAGVVAVTAQRNRVPYLSCRGYTSQSEMWRAGTRLKDWAADGQEVVVLHLGDHDPSGIDMSRDVQDRLALFMEEQADQLTFERLALNIDQVRRFNPPPNPAKMTDSRAGDYVKRFGRQSWELDALDPKTLDELIESAILRHRDEARWARAVRREAVERETLLKAARHWGSVAEHVEGIDEE